MGSKTGALLRDEILTERDELLRQAKENKPRDSELSAGKFDQNIDKVKQARIRVQNRLLQGNAVNSSDEDNDDNNDGGLGQNGKNTTVMHFKRKFKSGAATETRRRRAGRFGRRAGEDGGEESDVSYGSEEDSDDSDDDVEQELFCYDTNGFRVKGVYDAEGYFIVDTADRDVSGRCDHAGYLVDGHGYRFQNLEMA